MQPKSRKIMIVAGEDSGDAHGAKLVQALRQDEAGTHFEFFGAAGPRLRDAGVEPVVVSDEMSVVGLAEIGRSLPMFLKASRKLKAAAAARRPDAVILIDFPDFNLRLAKALKKSGFKVIYYISPQLWAWRKYRIVTIAKYVDLMLTILPFEKDWYARYGVTHVEYVGSPLAREVYATNSKEDFCETHGLDPARPIISLLPGSRRKEITRILPVMVDTASEITARVPNAQFVISLGSESNQSMTNMAIVRAAAKVQRTALIKIVIGETYNALNASDAAAVASGTATLEAGIIGTPLAVVYKTSAINYSLLEPLVSVDHYGLINLIAGERIAKELIQHDFTPGKLADEIVRLLNPEVNVLTRSSLKATADKLGHGGASKRAAEAILRLIDSK